MPKKLEPPNCTVVIVATPKRLRIQRTAGSWALRAKVADDFGEVWIQLARASEPAPLLQLAEQMARGGTFNCSPGGITQWPEDESPRSETPNTEPP